MSRRSNGGSTGLGILDVILIVNIILKLVGVITWSWSVVLWPLWVVIVLVILILIAIGLS